MTDIDEVIVADEGAELVDEAAAAVAPAPWKPTSSLGLAVYEAGFLYDPDQGIIYSRLDAVQRDFGYAYGYDAAAVGMTALIDCEPIFFDYAGKHWMIELWKGQYGLRDRRVHPPESAHQARPTTCSTRRSAGVPETMWRRTTCSTTARGPATC